MTEITDRSTTLHREVREELTKADSKATTLLGVIGIILSGGTRDGAQGMRDIAKAGGVGIVQRPGDAVEPRMPRNTIQNDHPRHCVDAADIAPLVQRLMANTE